MLSDEFLSTGPILPDKVRKNFGIKSVRRIDLFLSLSQTLKNWQFETMATKLQELLLLLNFS